MSLRSYANDSYRELTQKVTWPDWKSLQSSAIIVLVASIIIALIVFAMDYLFGINGDPEAPSLWRGILGWIYDILG